MRTIKYGELREGEGGKGGKGKKNREKEKARNIKRHMTNDRWRRRINANRNSCRKSRGLGPYSRIWKMKKRGKNAKNKKAKKKNTNMKKSNRKNVSDNKKTQRTRFYRLPCSEVLSLYLCLSVCICLSLTHSHAHNSLVPNTGEIINWEANSLNSPKLDWFCSSPLSFTVAKNKHGVNWYRPWGQ